MGVSRKETLGLIKEAIEFHIEGLSFIGRVRRTFQGNAIKFNPGVDLTVSGY